MTETLLPRRAGVRLGAVVAVVALLLGVRSLAVLSDTALVASGDVRSDACFTTRVEQVQNGTTVSSTDGVTTVAIAAVDPDRSFLTWTLRSTGSDPSDALVRGVLSDSTTISFVRDTDAAAVPSITIAWTVVEYTCGVRVQRGETVGNDSAILDVGIDPVDRSQSFALVSATPVRTDVTAGANDHLGTSLPATDTLRITAGAALPSTTRVAWQVVEFTRQGAALVQRVTASMPVGVGTGTAVLPTAVDPERTVLLGAATGPAPLGGLQVEPTLQTSTSVRFARSLTTQAITAEAWVVELRDGTLVQRGSLSLAPGATTATASIRPVDMSSTGVLTTAVGPGGAAYGRTDHAGSVLGEVQVTASLTDPATVVVRRGPSTSTSSFIYQVVEWGGPGWWDLDWASRQQLTVAGAGADVPDGYTTSVAFDHAAMVAAGQALADGRDVRVLRFDGITWTELDRVLDGDSSWDAASTTLWFRTLAAVGAAGRDGTYWLYTGNAAAGAPPTDPAAVWLLTDSFEDGDLSEYTEQAGVWYAADPWTTRVQLRIPAGQVTATLSDFPVLVDVTVPALVGVARSDGGDLRFTAADGVTRLSYELVAHDVATGHVQAWVKVPSIAPGTPTDLLLYAGAQDAPDQQDVHGTWSNGYLGVWHLDGDPTLDVLAADASPQDHDALATAGALPTATSGVGGGALGFAGPGTRPLDTGTAIAPRGAMTVSAIVQAASGSGALVGRGDAPDWRLAVTDVAGVARPAASLTVGGTTLTATAGATAASGHLAMRWDAGRLDVLDAGAVVATATLPGWPVAGAVAATPGSSVTLGGAPDGGEALPGTLDEVRIADVARSDAWLAAEAATASDPAAFVTVVTTTSGIWFDAGSWDARLPLTLSRDAITGAPGTVAVLVQVTDPALAADAAADARDVVVTDADGVTRLAHELVDFDPTSGTLQLWVRVPGLTAAADRVLYLYFDNPTAEDQQAPAAVFADDVVTLHLDGDPTVTP